MTETIQHGASPSEVEHFREEQLAATEALLETQAAVSAVVEALAFAPAGLDPAMAELIMRLARSPACGIRGVDIGQHCQMTATRVSRLLDRAEADGLVQRTPDPGDRRAQQVVLTGRGHEAAQRLAPLMGGVIDELVTETLSARERAMLIELLGRLRDRARQLLEDA